LVAHYQDLVRELTYSLMQGSDAFFNVVDISELHNLVYNAAEVASNSQSLTRMMLFDWILMKRNKVAFGAKNPDVRFIMGVGNPE
jgi:hypothetical protein